MKIEYNTIFDELGMTASDQKVYLAGLAMGMSTSRGMVLKTKLPRPTVMAAFKHLSELGVCTTTRADGRSMLYEMLPPVHFKSALGAHMRRLERLSQDVDTMQVMQSSKTYINEAHGWEDIQSLIELALRCQSRKWHIIAPRHNALSYMPTHYTEYFKKVRQERQIESETLWEESSMKELLLKDILMRKPRYVPSDIAPKIPTLQLAFDDCLLILDIENEKSVPYALLIQNKAIVTTFRVVFEMAWRSAIKN